MMAPPLGQQGQHISTARRSRSLMTVLTAAAGCALVVLLFASGGGRGGGGSSAGTVTGGGDDAAVAAFSSSSSSARGAGAAASAAARVPVTIYVMSRCPDAQFCEGFLAPILEPLKGVVRLRAEYIVREEEEQGGGKTKPRLACMHGPQECDGNKAQLCLQKRLDDQIAAGALSADATVATFLKFLNCGWKNAAAIGTEAGTRACLADVGWAEAERQDAVIACARGQEGEALLAASHAATKGAGATNSCTIDVAGRRRCVRDGGRFRDCEGGSEPADFARTICAALGDEARRAAAGVCK